MDSDCAVGVQVCMLSEKLLCMLICRKCSYTLCGNTDPLLNGVGFWTRGVTCWGVWQIPRLIDLEVCPFETYSQVPHMPEWPLKRVMICVTQTIDISASFQHQEMKVQVQHTNSAMVTYPRNVCQTASVWSEPHHTLTTTNLSIRSMKTACVLHSLGRLQD
jgi:hypothetical protein